VLSRWYYRKFSRKIKKFRRQNYNIKSQAVFEEKEQKPQVADFIKTPQERAAPPANMQMHTADNAIAKEFPAQTAAKSHNREQTKIASISGERLLFIIISSLLFLVVIFLAIKVKNLAAAVEKQNAYIENLQKGTSANRIIIYDVPASKIRLTQKNKI
jgi:hypothetical protein